MDGADRQPYGHFDDRAREYVITRPDTPLPWLNYLGGDGYVGLITHTGGGYAYYRDARLRRLTRYRYNGVPTDSGGRCLYLRDDETGGSWSPAFQPVGQPLDTFRCRHGLGYTVIESAARGIATETCYLVPPGESLELWRVRCSNRRPQPAQLSLFSCVEFCLWDAVDDAGNLQRNLSVGEVAVVDEVIYHVSEYRERRNHFAYFACSAPLAGFDTDRARFLGPLRGWDRPLVVERGQAEDSIVHGWAPCGSHHVRLTLAPGETRDVVFILGYAENPPGAKFDRPGSVRPALDGVRPLIERYRDPQRVDEEWARLRRSWDRRLGGLSVTTPSVHLDRMLNCWNPYQCRVTFAVSRSASLFETGTARGIGFRDACQDILGIVAVEPEAARRRLLELAAVQAPSGGVPHQLQPLTGRGNDAIGTGFHDDQLWLVVATAAYCKETGDLAVCDVPVAYADASAPAAPLYEHLRRSIRFTVERLGPHDLPLIGRADWNDCLNLNCFSTTPGESFQTTENRSGGVAESILIAGLFCHASAELAAIADRRGRGREAASLLAQRARMAAAVAAHGWDGGWFLRAFDHFGSAVGTAAANEGRIFIEPQGLCVLAGIGLDDGRAEVALDSVARHLISEDGLMLVQPAFTAYDPRLGEITSYPPGVKENGSVFCHTNPWIVIAEAMVGNGRRAFDYYLRTNPSARAARSDRHRCEPYVYAQTIAGRDAAVPGEAKNSWLTGAASWNLVAASQWILGIRPEHGGLRIDPCLPPDWPGFRAVRRFRQATYRIHVRQDPGTSGRVAELRVDGRRLAGNLVPVAPPGGVVEVEAVARIRQVEPRPEDEDVLAT